jgi:hypothetical protein
MGAAESAVLQSITDMAAESQSPDPLRFTAALTNGRWLFMHNGFVGGWNRVRRRVEAMIRTRSIPRASARRIRKLCFS